VRAITFHDWMKAALYGPHNGYYHRPDRERWGRAGDYRTSPERSSLFAATFARYFARLFEELGRPREWTIVECGAGGGYFAEGVLDTLVHQFRDAFEATHYVVYDVSLDAMRRTQLRLGDYGDRVRFSSSFDEIRIDNGLIFSNELLDAFPVHRVVQAEQGLAELYVSVDSNGDFCWSEGPLSTPRLAEFCTRYAPKLAIGQVIEVNLEIDDWFSRVAARLANGFVITVDYGAESDELYDPALRPNGTLRGFRRHEFVDDVLAQPGEYDITASINWTQVRIVGEGLGLEVVEFASQDKFLLNCGLPAELEYRLSLAESEAEKASLTTGAKEMILPGGMASSFQVLVQRRI
jgi:SAM-dependent MidA family methyltransferase